MNTPVALASADRNRIAAPDPRASRVLLVEDEAAAVGQLYLPLQDAGFRVSVECDPIDAFAALQREVVDVLVLDIDIGRPEGRGLLQRARQSDGTLPVLVLGVDGTLAHRVQAIELGADDYLVKPVATEELAVLIRARVQRRRAEADSMLRAGRLEIDLRSHQVRADGARVDLTGREFALLQLLVEAGGRTVPRPMLQERLGEWGGAPASNAVDVHVHRIRRKVGRDNIHTFRGGYAVAA